MSNWTKVIAAIGIVLTLVAVGCAPQATAPTTEKVVKIGISGALTGALRMVGCGATAAQDYYNYLNETEGGIKYKDPKTGKTEHAKIEVLFGDHGWDAAKSISLYERQKAAGAQMIMVNGSVPALSTYTLCARDHIPSLPLDCSTDVVIMDSILQGKEKPYMLGSGIDIPRSTAAAAAWIGLKEWKGSGKVKIGYIMADIATRRVVEKPEVGLQAFFPKVNADVVGIEFCSATPLDLKTELNRLVGKGANWIVFDHWSVGAHKVFINDATTLKLDEKGIALIPEFMPPEVGLSEADKYDNYQKKAPIRILNFGWNGTEVNVLDNPLFSGYKLVFDVVKRYHPGETPESLGGWFYVYGYPDAMLFEQVFRAALEKTGYEGLTREALRDELFRERVIECGGIEPPTYLDPQWPLTKAYLGLSVIRGGHVIFDQKNPWIEAPPVWKCPRFIPKTPVDWGSGVWSNYVK